MRIGLQIPVFTWPGGPAQIGSRLAEIGRTADEMGFASLWVMDRFFQIEGADEVDEPMLESYSTVSYLAGVS
jgi:alkanesulfonate monooxygenase SsuD/methylene tetrahydromethanopterin reductase-like flavin-dependent oxidoreductase (luciferase family)